ncbi:neuromedin U [Nitrospira sp.]|uniref:neuromedin U n=1 Tax=Nitrospira sp. TaxID=70125 RepID=UPI003FCDB88E
MLISQITFKSWFIAGVIIGFLGSQPAHAEDIEQLAKEVENPVSDLVRAGFTNSTFFGAGANNHLFNTFNLQISTTRRFGDWALLNRLAIPLPYLPANAIMDKTGSLAGLGDIAYTGFLARDESKRRFKLIGGFGPTFILNTATDDRLGSGKWSVGPTLAFVSLPDPWVVGAIIGNFWSFAGDTQRQKVNLFLVEPFVNYNFPNGWYVTSTPSITANWEAEEKRNRWRVPIGGGVGKVMFRGEKRPINLKLQGFYFLEKQDRSADWTLQLQFQILFPDKPA